MINNVDTVHRHIPEGTGVFDISIKRSKFNMWLKNLPDLGRKLGVIYNRNPKSSILLICPHGQEGVLVYDESTIDPDRDLQVQLLERNPVPWESTDARIGKAVVYPKEDATGEINYMPTGTNPNEESGRGDSISQQLTLETAYILQQLSGEVPNITLSTISQASIDNNDGTNLGGFGVVSKTELNATARATLDSFMVSTDVINDAAKSLDPKSPNYKRDIANLSTAKTINNFRNEVFAQAILQEKTDKPLVFNIHTAFNRKEESGGNPNIEVILGSCRGLSLSDFKVEIALARFLKMRGFNIIMTSLFEPTSEVQTINGEEMKPKKKMEGESERWEEYQKYVKERGVEISEFERDTLLEKLNRLRGTSIMTKLKKEIAKEHKQANLIQLEVVRDVLADNNRRLALAKALAQFCFLYDQGKIIT